MRHSIWYGWDKDSHAPFLLEGRRQPGNRWQPSCNYPSGRARLLTEPTRRRGVRMGRETRSWWHHLSPSADQIYPWTGQLYDLINSSLTWSSLCWDRAHCLNQKSPKIPAHEGPSVRYWTGSSLQSGTDFGLPPLTFGKLGWSLAHSEGSK